MTEGCKFFKKSPFINQANHYFAPNQCHSDPKAKRRLNSKIFNRRWDTESIPKKHRSILSTKRRKETKQNKTNQRSSMSDGEYHSGSSDEEDDDYDEEYEEEIAKKAMQKMKQPAAPQGGGNLVDRIFGGDVLDDLRDQDAEGKKKKKAAQIAQWPFDGYHMVQQKYYEFQDNKKKDEDPNTKLFTRPPDLEDIPTAVQNLPLGDEFEKTAKERAIGIVSTWIFDAGLIDELTGGPDMGMMGPGGGGEVQGSITETQNHQKGHAKMDKEIAKLRESTGRELAMIKNRLNDGVSASGLEVRELVNAVEGTKTNLAKLRDLAQKVSNGGDEHGKHKFLLTHYPKLKTAIFARRNLHRCFRELEFFWDINSRCSRLRHDLNACEWKEHEWETIREVCREHVEMQLFLVEAETDLHRRMQESWEHQSEDDEEDYDHKGQKILKRQESTADENYEPINRFLQEHLATVWELGEEIERRVLSGVENALGLAGKKPAGMVALVEAVECYEDAADEFRRVHAGIDLSRQTGRYLAGNKPLRSITEMRKKALQHIASDFEKKAIAQFDNGIQAAIDAIPPPEDDFGDYGIDEDMKLVPTFNAILKAANSLTRQIGKVQNDLSPCFPPFWSIETLWLTCVAAVCAKKIVEQIGPENVESRQLPPNAFPTQLLLDLVAWIESFREEVRKQFPDIINIASDTKVTYEKLELVEMKVLMKGKEFDTKTAKNLLGRVTRILWSVKLMAQQGFIDWTNESVDDWLGNVYKAEHQRAQTQEGMLTTSLPEDLFALAGVQMRTIQSRLTKKSTVLVEAVGAVFTKMRINQKVNRNARLNDFEDCCASANDFLRMVDQCEELVEDLVRNSDLPDDAQDDLQNLTDQLCLSYTNDAVYAAQRVHKYIFDDLQKELGDKMFEDDWESDQKAEMSKTIVSTLEDWMGDVVVFMDPTMVRKALAGLIKASINFYIKALIRKAGKKGGQKESCFEKWANAKQSIFRDTNNLRAFFDGFVPQHPALITVIKAEFSVITEVFGFLFLADDDDKDEEEDEEDDEEEEEEDEDETTIEFFFKHQKMIQDVETTKLFLGDLFHLVNPRGEKKMYELYEKHEEQLKHLELAKQESYQVDAHYIDKDLQLAEVIKATVNESTRSRPLPGSGITGAFTKGWFGGGGKETSTSDQAPATGPPLAEKPAAEEEEKEDNEDGENEEDEEEGDEADEE